MENPNDRFQEQDTSRIYHINCEICPMKYIRWTKRNIKTLTKTHFLLLKYNRPDKSAIAKHFLENHYFKEENTELLKHVTKLNKIDSLETFYINKFHNIFVNNELGTNSILI